jgi:putative endonuclease
MKGYMYILKCSDGSYYTGSTNDLECRLAQHQSGEGANFTRKHLPVELVYFEEFQQIDEAFYREKQVQGWSRKKKEALINDQFGKLADLAKNYTQYPRNVASTSSATGAAVAEPIVMPFPLASTSSATAAVVEPVEIAPVASTSSATATVVEPVEIAPVASTSSATAVVAEPIATPSPVAEPVEATNNKSQQSTRARARGSPARQ